MADRASAIGAWDQPLRVGLDLEGEAGIATLMDPTLAEGLARFASGERPEITVDWSRTERSTGKKPQKLTVPNVARSTA